MHFLSPLRYPGGKGKVAGYFRELFRRNDLCDAVYIEPYAGGAAVAWSLLFGEYASKVIINDKDKAIYAFWHSVLKHTDELCKLITDTPVNVRTWNRLRRLNMSQDDSDLLALGFSTFYMNRTNRSGIIRGGIIGGQHQDGNWGIDARYNKRELIRRIERIAEYSGRVEVSNEDALVLVQRLRRREPSKYFYYFDPPYYHKGQALYLNHYQPKDHQRIAQVVRSLESKWVVTYDNVPAIAKLYRGHRKSEFTISYTATTPSVGRELMIYSNGLKAPRLSLHL